MADFVLKKCPVRKKTTLSEFSYKKAYHKAIFGLRPKKKNNVKIGHFRSDSGKKRFIGFRHTMRKINQK